MPVPSSIADLSQTPGSNSPAGSESPITTDNYLREYSAYIAQLRDGKNFTDPVTLASTTTTDIGAQNSLFVEITGTTTITGFGTTYNGPRFLRFTGILTLTHNATTLNLPGAANIATAAGDTAIAVPNSTPNGWNVVAFQRAALAPGIASSASTATTATTATNIASGGAGQIPYQSASGTTAMLAAGAATQVLIGGASAPAWQTSRLIAQVQESFSGAVATGTTVMVLDDTIPQNTEGDQYYSVAITPLSATSTLEIEALLNVSSSIATQFIAALFVDTTADALAAGRGSGAAGPTQPVQIAIKHSLTSGSTSARTYKLRAGATAAGTTTVNGVSGARSLGGVLLSGIRVTEILA